MRARRRRVIRGSAAALIATVIASTAHTLSGGGAPPVWLLLAVTALASPIAVALIGSRPSLPRLAATVALAQIMLHTAFAAVGTDAPAQLSGHAHGLVPLGEAVASPATGMTAGHVAAAVVTTLLLATGERMLAALGRGIRRLLRLPATRALALRAPGRPAPVVRRVHAALILTSVSRRGPPAFAR